MRLPRDRQPADERRPVDSAGQVTTDGEPGDDDDPRYEPVLDPAREERARLGRRRLGIDVLGDDRADLLERPPVPDRGERGTLERIDRGVEHGEVVPPDADRRRPRLGLGRRFRPDLVHRPRALDDVEGGDHLEAEVAPGLRAAIARQVGRDGPASRRAASNASTARALERAPGRRATGARGEPIASSRGTPAAACRGDGPTDAPTDAARGSAGEASRTRRRAPRAASGSPRAAPRGARQKYIVW